MADPGIRIDPAPAPRDPRAMYATFIFERTADAHVTQAGCLTTPAEVPTSYCYFEVTATVPEPPFMLELVPLLGLLGLLARWKGMNRWKT